MLFISGEDNELAPGVPELHLQADEDITIILPDGDEIYVDGSGGISLGDGRILWPAPGPEPGIRAHVDELHPRVSTRGVSDEELARKHGREHHQFGSHSHHHGPNAGPHARPIGWRDGSGVVLIDRQAAKRTRPEHSG